MQSIRGDDWSDHPPACASMRYFTHSTARRKHTQMKGSEMLRHQPRAPKGCSNDLVECARELKKNVRPAARSCHCCSAAKLPTWLSWACRRSIWKGMRLRQRMAWRGALTMPLRTCEMHGTALVVVRSINVCTSDHQLLDLRFTGECQHPACWSPSRAMLAELMPGVHTPPPICAVCDAGRLASGHSPQLVCPLLIRESHGTLRAPAHQQIIAARGGALRRLQGELAHVACRS